jgi:hypothetical protein
MTARISLPEENNCWLLENFPNFTKVESVASLLLGPPADAQGPRRIGRSAHTARETDGRAPCYVTGLSGRYTNEAFASDRRGMWSEESLNQE